MGVAAYVKPESRSPFLSVICHCPSTRWGAARVVMETPTHDRLDGQTDEKLPVVDERHVIRLFPEPTLHWLYIVTYLLENINS